MISDWDEKSLRIAFVTVAVVFLIAGGFIGIVVFPRTVGMVYGVESWPQAICSEPLKVAYLDKFPVSEHSSPDDIREAFMLSGYFNAIVTQVERGKYPSSYLDGMNLDPVGWLRFYETYLTTKCPKLFVKPSSSYATGIGIIIHSGQAEYITTTVTKTITESEAVLIDLKAKIAFWLSDWKYPQVEYKHSFLALPYRVYVEEIRVSSNGDLELYGVTATVVESGKVYEYKSLLVKKEKQ